RDPVRARFRAIEAKAGYDDGARACMKLPDARIRACGAGFVVAGDGPDESDAAFWNYDARGCRGSGQMTA
ncbi:MAG TPA: hypothetical protein VKS03_04710, partial [Thermoanaerobaculia bacterium]|nr:hypothetical protein [Thermoanaerobaculia bacterium]